MMDQRQLRDMLDYDPATGIMVWRNCSKYHARKNGKEAGVITPSRAGKYYCKLSIAGKRYARSRLAFLWMTGRWPTEQVDHINGNSLDDRWENLREVTQTQNAWNHKGRKREQSDLPMGVRRLGRRFQARLAVNKTMVHLGTFETAQQASETYRKAREVHYGEFA